MTLSRLYRPVLRDHLKSGIHQRGKRRPRESGDIPLQSWTRQLIHPGQGSKHGVWTQLAIFATREDCRQAAPRPRRMRQGRLPANPPHAQRMPSRRGPASCTWDSVRFGGKPNRRSSSWVMSSPKVTSSGSISSSCISMWKALVWSPR